MQLCATIITVKQTLWPLFVGSINVFSLPFMVLIIVQTHGHTYVQVPWQSLLISDQGAQSRYDFRSLYYYTMKYLLTWEIFITKYVIEK